jgi:hypothetical protein
MLLDMKTEKYTETYLHVKRISEKEKTVLAWD